MDKLEGKISNTRQPEQMISMRTFYTIVRTLV